MVRRRGAEGDDFLEERQLRGTRERKGEAQIVTRRLGPPFLSLVFKIFPSPLFEAPPPPPPETCCSWMQLAAACPDPPAYLPAVVVPPARCGLIRITGDLIEPYPPLSKCAEWICGAL